MMARGIANVPHGDTIDTFLRVLFICIVVC
jgi:hypothetical protein